MDESGRRSLPRLKAIFYQGDAVTHWTLTVNRRETGWLNEGFHAEFRELLLHACVREDLVCPVYCLMPDHLHFMWMGLHPDSDQLNGMAFLRTHLEPLLAPRRFQHQPHDHVLSQAERTQNAFAKVCFYILENPVRAGLVQSAELWRFAGALVPGYPKLHPREENFWDIFWKLYTRKKIPEASERALPPREG